MVGSLAETESTEVRNGLKEMSRHNELDFDIGVDIVIDSPTYT